MKYLLLIILISGLIGCLERPEPFNIDPEFKFDCVRVEHIVYRCENKEAICYISRSNNRSPECKFKY